LARLGFKTLSHCGEICRVKHAGRSIFGRPFDWLGERKGFVWLSRRGVHWCATDRQELKRADAGDYGTTDAGE
jgi:hypothetical protein